MNRFYVLVNGKWVNNTARIRQEDENLKLMLKINLREESK